MAISHDLNPVYLAPALQADRDAILVPGVAVFLVIMAFFPVLTPAHVTSSEMTLGRSAELGLLCVAAAFVIIALLHQRCSLSLSSMALYASCVYAAWALCSSLWSVSPMLSFAKSVQLIMLCVMAGLLALYLKATVAHISDTLVRTLTWAVLAAIATLLLANIVIWGTPLKLSEPNLYTGRPGRFFLGYSHPLETAELLMMGIVVTFLSRYALIFRGAVIAVLLWLLLLTNARNHLAVLPVIFAFIVFAGGRPEVRFMVVLAALGAALSVALLLSWGSLADRLPVDFWTLNGRVPLWEKTLEIVWENPVVGVGYFGSRYFLLPIFEWAGHAHNSYIEALLTTGIIGLAILLAFLWYCCTVAFRARSTVLGALLIFCMLTSLFNPLVLIPNAPTFVLLVAVIAVAECGRRQRSLGTDYDRVPSG